jgi:hypothetical protein
VNVNVNAAGGQGGSGGVGGTITTGGPLAVGGWDCATATSANT